MYLIVWLPFSKHGTRAFKLCTIVNNDGCVQQGKSITYISLLLQDRMDRMEFCSASNRGDLVLVEFQNYALQKNLVALTFRNPNCCSMF